MHPLFLFFTLMLITTFTHAAITIPDTGQNDCFSNTSIINCPKEGQSLHGQDAQYNGNQPSYRDNKNGTITDLVTQLTWSKAVDDRKVSLQEAKKIASKMTLGGHNDWRVPNIKELYSLIDFRGYTGFAGRNSSSSKAPYNAIPFINTDYFEFKYGAPNERYIDGQWLSSTKYVSTTMGGAETLFGVNFADGRIKGYGYKRPNSSQVRKKFYVRYVRGNSYGHNNFVDNGNNTINDKVTNLTWTRVDSQQAMTWKQALSYAENLKTGGHDDWRLPNAKELQYIVDYSRSPDTSHSASINPLFNLTQITNEADQKDYPFYWTSTTHHDGPQRYSNAAYITMGRGIGQLQGKIMDVHGAGAQRSDPKEGTAKLGRGPQGDAIRVKNYVICVRGGATKVNTQKPVDGNKYPYVINVSSNANVVSGSLRGPGGNQNTQSRPGMNSNSNRPNNIQRGFTSQRTQGGRGPNNSSGPTFITRLDNDGDGKVSRNEFDGPPDRFDFHDANGDGYLSDEEAPQGPPPGRR